MSALLKRAGLLGACRYPRHRRVLGHGQHLRGHRHPAPIRTYFIAADEVEWDYAPQRPTTDHGRTIRRGGQRLHRDRPGAHRDRCTSRRCTASTPTATFTKLKPARAAGEHLGMLGPVIRADRGRHHPLRFQEQHAVARSASTRTASSTTRPTRARPTTTAPRGADKGDDAVPPGGSTHVYTWAVPERAGPGTERRQLGVLDVPLAHRRGGRHLLRPDGSDRDHRARAWPAPTARPSDVDRELVTMFIVIGREPEPLPRPEHRQLAGDPGSVDPEDEGFIESNLMHSINGYFFGNLPGLDDEARASACAGT